MLKHSSPSRVVTVSSNGHRFSKLNTNDLNMKETPYDRVVAYGNSKIANILFTRELARRLDG
jgi:NAD(P)-dependent dehydrogenase (short-subunit alcohol dehydrogenase family)